MCMIRIRNPVYGSKDPDLYKNVRIRSTAKSFVVCLVVVKQHSRMEATWRRTFNKCFTSIFRISDPYSHTDPDPDPAFSESFGSGS